MNFGTSGVDLLAMSVDDSEDLSLTLWLDLTVVGGALWPLAFDPLNEDCPGSSFVTVTRIDLETWEIEATIEDVACLARQAGGNNQIFSGLYHMPFRFTVKLK